MLTVFVGPMGSGKSKILIDRIEASSNHLIFKPIIDNRTQGVVHSRNGKSKEAINIKDIKDIFKHLSFDVDHVFIDEVQFFNDIENIKELVILSNTFNFDIHVSGLDLDSDFNIFTSTSLFMAYADKIEKLSSICEDCNNKDTYISYCTIKKDGQILTGDTVYKPLCLSCYLEQ